MEFVEKRINKANIIILHGAVAVTEFREYFSQANVNLLNWITLLFLRVLSYR